VLNDFSIPHASHKTKRVPLTGYDHLRPATPSDKRIDITEYQRGIRSIMYATVHTRPDTAFTLGKLSQYMKDPAAHHGHALKGLLRYLRSTIDQKIRFGPTKHQNFILYSDADWAGDRTDRKSTSGNVGLLYRGAITWRSIKQNSVATSSTKSEYIAMSLCYKVSQ
jgi:hypothetical protein